MGRDSIKKIIVRAYVFFHFVLILLFHIFNFHINLDEFYMESFERKNKKLSLKNIKIYWLQMFLERQSLKMSNILLKA